jgi:hypothetical protein
LLKLSSIGRLHSATSSLIFPLAHTATLPQRDTDRTPRSSRRIAVGRRRSKWLIEAVSRPAVCESSQRKTPPPVRSSGMAAVAGLSPGAEELDRYKNFLELPLALCSFPHACRALVICQVLLQPHLRGRF